MSDLINGIFEIKRSKSYIDYKNYHKGNIFGITKMARRELMHSNFIAWALSPESSHSLGYYPLYQLIRSLGIIQGNADNTKARKIDSTYSDSKLLYKFFDDNFIVDAKVYREHAIPVGKTKKYIDVLIEITTKDKILPIVIENKVESPENGPDGDQTKIYFEWAEKKYADTTKYLEPIYIYLYPEYKTQMQTQEEYIRMTYQDLVDNVLDPSLSKCGDLVSIQNYKVYLQALSFQSDNEKGENTMAISNEEKEIFKSFVTENEDLLCAVLSHLKDLIDVDEDAISLVTSSIKDKTQYEFNGQKYGKGRLVLAVVQKYVEDNPSTTYSDLLAAFPDVLQGGKSGVLKMESSVPDEEKGIGPDAHKRYFVKGKDIIKLPATKESILVCREWGIGNINNFINHVTTILGYKIDII